MTRMAPEGEIEVTMMELSKRGLDEMGIKKK
jgi:hypothetical protein